MKSVKFFLSLLVLTITYSAFAQSSSLPAVGFKILTSNGEEKIERVLFNPEDMIKRYRPTGATISKKSVDHNQFQFYAKKTVFFYTATVFVHSTFVVVASDSCSSSEDKGYLATLEFSGSDKMLTDNIERYEALICVRQDFSDELKVNVQAKIFKGNNYNRVIGPIMFDMIGAQTKPLIEAMTEEVKRTQL